MTELGSHPLLTTPPGTARQWSSRHRDARGGDWLGLRPDRARRKRILLEPGESCDLLAVAGAGLVTRLWMTTLFAVRRRALVDLVLRCWWDGESAPSVEASMGDFFGAPFGSYRSYQSAHLSLTSGGFNCSFPMPFASGARISIRNEGPRTVDPVYFAVTYYELDEPPATPLRFHAAWRHESPTAPGEPYTILEADGAGHFVGCRLDMQNREWWITHPPATAAYPYGLGFGMLEGMEHIYVDGEERPSVVGTGTEDFFNAAWYYYLGRFSAPSHGCTVRNWLRGRVSAYRFDVDAPIPFERSIRVTINHGHANEVSTEYASVAYWYQAEPHRPSAGLPSPQARRPRVWVGNLVQPAALVASVALATGRAATAIARRASGDAG